MTIDIRQADLNNSRDGRAIVEVLENLRRNHDLAVWMVTHQLAAVRGRVDRMVELEAGRLAEGNA